MVKSRKMRRVRNPDDSSTQTAIAEPKVMAQESASSSSSKTPVILIAGIVSVALAGAAWWYTTKYIPSLNSQSNFRPADQRTSDYLATKAREESRIAAAAESERRRTSQGTPQAGNVTNRPFSNQNHLLNEWFVSNFSGSRPVPSQGDTSIDVNDRDTIEAVQRVLMGLGYRRNGDGNCANEDHPYCRITPTGAVDDGMRESLRMFMTVENESVTGLSRERLETHRENPIHPDVFYAVVKYVSNRPGYFWTEGTDEARTKTMLSKFYTPITAPARGLPGGYYAVLSADLGDGAYDNPNRYSERAERRIVVSSRRKRL